MGDNVNHPKHYQNIAGVETIDILNDVVKDLPGKQAAMLWNSMKYLFRFQKKNGIEDLKKSRNYLDYLIADVEATNEAAKNIMAKSPAPKEIKTDHGPCVIYESKISGHAEVYYSTDMPEGTCVTIAFTSELVRDMFISNFFRYLSYNSHKFSIRDVLADTNFIDPDGTVNFSTELPWKDLFAEFRLRSIKDKYFLDLVYKKDALDTLEEMPATSDKCNLYKSTVWGSVEVYYSTDMPEGTCTKLLFDDKGGRDTFAIKFFRYLSYNSHRFSIRDILEETKFMFSKEDDNLSVTMPWNDVFKGFHITDEAGKYALEFIIDLKGGK